MQIADLLADGPNSLVAEIARSLPANTILGFEIRGAGGGEYTLWRYAGGHRLLPSGDRFVDGRLVCSVDDFAAIVRGEVDALAAFRDGRIEVQGDVTVFLALHRAIRGRLAPSANVA